jgi:hypothetical protein
MCPTSALQMEATSALQMEALEHLSLFCVTITSCTFTEDNTPMLRTLKLNCCDYFEEFDLDLPHLEDINFDHVGVSRHLLHTSFVRPPPGTTWFWTPGPDQHILRWHSTTATTLPVHCSAASKLLQYFPVQPPLWKACNTLTWCCSVQCLKFDLAEPSDRADLGMHGAKS